MVKKHVRSALVHNTTPAAMQLRHDRVDTLAMVSAKKRAQRQARKDKATSEATTKLPLPPRVAPSNSREASLEEAEF
jgi:hypothetical protein